MATELLFGQGCGFLVYIEWAFTAGPPYGHPGIRIDFDDSRGPSAVLVARCTMNGRDDTYPEGW